MANTNQTNPFEADTTAVEHAIYSYRTADELHYITTIYTGEADAITFTEEESMRQCDQGIFFRVVEVSTVERALSDYKNGTALAHRIKK